MSTLNYFFAPVPYLNRRITSNVKAI